MDEIVAEINISCDTQHRFDKEIKFHGGIIQEGWKYEKEYNWIP